jgi:hypothetical protein
MIEALRELKLNNYDGKEERSKLLCVHVCTCTYLKRRVEGYHSVRACIQTKNYYGKSRFVCATSHLLSLSV